MDEKIPKSPLKKAPEEVEEQETNNKFLFFFLFMYAS